MTNTLNLEIELCKFNYLVLIMTLKMEVYKGLFLIFVKRFGLFLLIHFQKETSHLKILKFMPQNIFSET